MASSSSSSSAIATYSSTTFPSFSGREFDVLLSFGKGDEGSTIFAEQLSEALHERDIRVFVDRERPAGGDDGAYEVNMRGVIEGSSVCIPILCSKYAYSRQCLRELSECVAGKKIILPIFYGVEPSDVRRQRGPFEPAFRDHNLRLDERTVEKWRDALEVVGEIVGYIVAEIDADGLEMHDQLRELGRSIARGRSSLDSGSCSRLWVTDEVLDVLDNQKATENLEGIVVDLRGLPSKRRVKTKSFARMKNLRLLRANFAEFQGNFNHMPRGLRWLEWHGCSLKSLPNDFNLEEVAVLDLSLSKLVQLSISRCYFRKKVFNELKVLFLIGCLRLKKIADFSSLPRLEKLILSGSRELAQVDESIGKLDRLTVLRLSSCSKLKKLPDALCGLSSLKTLDLSSCTALQKLPKQWGLMGSFKNLRHLSLFGCSSLQDLPDSFGVMPRLEKLNLMQCLSLKSLPNSIGDMKRLSELYLTNVGLEQLPPSVGSLEEPKGLWMFGCKKLRRSLPDTIGCLSKLEKLNLNYCKSLKALPASIGSMKNLAEFYFNFADIKELPKSTESLGMLQRLYLYGCKNLVALPDGFVKLTKLEKLELTVCSSFRKLPDSIGNVKSLTEIRLARTSIELLPDSFTNLKKLNIQGCIKLRSLPLGMMKSLRYLYVKGRGEEEYKDDDSFELPESIVSKSWHSHNSEEYRRLEFTSCEEAYSHFKIQWKLFMRVQSEEWVVLVKEEHNKEWGMHRGMQWLRLIFPTGFVPVDEN